MDAKRAIKIQFMKEYGKRDFADITVKALCAAVPVASTTFYYYFDNTDEVRSEIEDELIRGLIAVAEKVSGGDPEGMDFTAFMDETEPYIRDHWQDIYLFLAGQPNLRFIRKWKDAIMANYFKRNPKMLKGKNHEAIAEILASSMISAYTYWMEHPEDVKPAEIKPLLIKVLNSLDTCE
jgi:AcrR family transcriptional regulator